MIVDVGLTMALFGVLAGIVWCGPSVHASRDVQSSAACDPDAPLVRTCTCAPVDFDECFVDETV